MGCAEVCANISHIHCVMDDGMVVTLWPIWLDTCDL